MSSIRSTVECSRSPTWLRWIPHKVICFTDLMVSNLVVGVFEGFERLAGATVVKPRSTKPYRSGAKYGTMPIIAPAHISVLNFAWFIVPLIAVGCF
jgi:hypothetical protein